MLYGILFIHLLFNDHHFTVVIDCGLPESLEGGSVHVTSTIFDSEAIYTCNSDRFLVGDRVRLCGITGTWSGRVPTCQRKSSVFFVLNLDQ